MATAPQPPGSSPQQQRGAGGWIQQHRGLTAAPQAPAPAPTPHLRAFVHIGRVAESCCGFMTVCRKDSCMRHLQDTG
jgi:hypothetical protein